MVSSDHSGFIGQEQPLNFDKPMQQRQYETSILGRPHRQGLEFGQ